MDPLTTNDDVNDDNDASQHQILSKQQDCHRGAINHSERRNFLATKRRFSIWQHLMPLFNLAALDAKYLSGAEAIESLVFKFPAILERERETAATRLFCRSLN